MSERLLDNSSFLSSEKGHGLVGEELDSEFRDRLRGRAWVLAAVGVSNPTLWRMERAGKFPPRRQISPARVGWLQSEVEEWLANRPRVGMDRCLD